MTDLLAHAEPEVIDLEAGSEWRFELEADETIAVRVTTSDPVYINAEELPTATWYPLHRHLKGSLYAATASQFQVSSLPASQYTSSSTTEPQLVNIHLALERLRILAHRQASSSNGHAAIVGTGRGPRVMVLGPPSSGKTTVLRNLVNMALGTGMGWTPAVVGLDPSSPANLIPGSLSMSTPSQPLPTHHLAHPFGSPPASMASNTVSADVGTLAWWFGHVEPVNRSVDVWRKLVTAMGERWRERCDKDSIALASGLFVDTSSAFTNPLLGTRKDDIKARYSLVAQAAEAFEIDFILVIGHEKLTVDLDRLLSPRGVRVVRIPKSGGAVDLDDSFHTIAHAFQIRTYLYGEPRVPQSILRLGKGVAMEQALSPYSCQIGFEVLTVLRVGEEHAAPSTALPLGSTRVLSPTRLTKIDPSGPAHIVRLLNTVLALVATKPGDRIPKKGRVGEVKKEEAADTEGKDEVEPDKEGDDVKVEEEDDDEDEVPYKEEIGWREVLGFIVITAIDTQKRKYTILSPSPDRKLPSTVAIAGSIEWVDTA